MEIPCKLFSKQGREGSYKIFNFNKNVNGVTAFIPCHNMPSCHNNLDLECNQISNVNQTNILVLISLYLICKSLRITLIQTWDKLCWILDVIRDMLSEWTPCCPIQLKWDQNFIFQCIQCIEHTSTSFSLTLLVFSPMKISMQRINETK